MRWAFLPELGEIGDDAGRRTRVCRSTTLDQKQDVVKHLPDVVTGLMDRNDDGPAVGSEIAQGLQDILRGESVQSCDEGSGSVKADVHRGKLKSTYRKSAHRHTAPQDPTGAEWPAKAASSLLQKYL